MAKKRVSQAKPRRITPPRVMCKPETKDVLRPAGLTVAAAVGRELNQDELVHALITIGAVHLDEVAQFIRAQDTPPPAPGGGGGHA